MTPTRSRVETDPDRRAQLPARIVVLAGAALLVASLAGPASAITRSQAIAIVTASIIDTSSVKSSLSAYAFQSTIAAGSVIAQNTLFTLGSAPSTSWFFWLDMAPPAFFAHSTKFVLVDNATGVISMVVDASWWPTINGVTHYADQTDRESTPDIFWRAGVPAPKQRVRDLRLEGPASPIGSPPRTIELLSGPEAPLAPAAGGSWGLIVCPYDTLKNPMMAADVRCAKMSFDSLGASGKLLLPPAPVVVNKTKQQVCDAIEALPDSCGKLVFYWVGHGKTDSLCFPGGGALSAKELAAKLKNQKANEYCVIIEACTSGTFLDDLAEAGVNGFHVTSTDDMHPAVYFDDGDWAGPFVGAWYSHYLWECILGGQRGVDAYLWANTGLAALMDSIKSSADSTKWKPYVDQNHPKGAYVHVFGGGGAGQAGGGEPFRFKVAAGCSTLCINMRGAAGSDTCGNFTISCRTANGTDSTWVKAGSHNWTLGRNIYLRTYGVPGATGEYQIAMHSNKGGVRALVTWLGDTATAVTPPAFFSEYNAHSIGWRDGAYAEFDTLLGAGTNGTWNYSWFDGVPFTQIPAITGPQWFHTVQTTIPLAVDPLRPQLYVGGDPSQGYAERTVLIFLAASLRGPFGGPADSAAVNAQAFQSGGFFDTFQGTFHSSGSKTTLASAADGLTLMWDLGTIRPEPLHLTLGVFGPGAVAWDAVVMLPASAVGTSVPPVPVSTVVRLYQNAPNPFNPGTTIRFEMPRSGPVRLSVFDVTGRVVRTLLDEARAAGPGVAFWDGKTAGGSALPSGVYFYRLETPSGVESRKMTLLK